MNCRKEYGCHTWKRLTSCLCWRVETTDRWCLFVYAIGKQKWCSRCALFMSSKKFLKTPAQLHKQHHVALAKSPVTISKTQRDAGRILWWITKAQTRMTVQRELSCSSPGSRLLLFISGCTMSLFVGGRTSLITYLQISPQQRRACRQCLVVEMKQRIIQKKQKKNCRTIWVEKATNTLSFFQHWQWSSQRTIYSPPPIVINEVRVAADNGEKTRIPALTTGSLLRCEACAG